MSLSFPTQQQCSHSAGLHLVNKHFLTSVFKRLRLMCVLNLSLHFIFNTPTGHNKTNSLTGNHSSKRSSKTNHRRHSSVRPQVTYLQSTYTGFFLNDLQDPLGRKQEVDEAAEAVTTVLPLHHTKELPEDGGSSGTEGTVQRRQGALDAVVQRLSVLRAIRCLIRLQQ